MRAIQSGRVWFVAVFVVATFLGGCTTQIGVAPTDSSLSALARSSSQVTRLWWWNDLDNRKLVYRYGLGTWMREDAEQALAELRTRVAECNQAEETATLANLMLLYGQKLERVNPEKSLSLHLTTAALSYRHLVDRDGPSATNEWNRRLRRTYNQATAGVVDMLQALPDGMRTNHLVTAYGESFYLQVVSGDSAVNLLNYDRWLPADHWEQSGLNARYRTDGLGTRLIAFCTNRMTDPVERHRPDEGIFDHATAVLIFPKTLQNSTSARPARLTFYNPVFTPEVELDAGRCRLAADYTMPWAMLLSRTRPLFKTRWSALMHPAETPRPRRVYLLGPYAPDRIPVLMVHGLRSTPLAWQQLTNELLGDPEIRERYQFWHYLYPTGLPFLTSAADFREELEQVRKVVDPDGNDLATQHMIVIGHSMGGLLARTLVTDSGDAMWNSTFAVPASGIEPDLEPISVLRRMFYFQPKPYVKRTIFIAVPHRGSKSADGLIGRIVSRRVHLPDKLHAFISDLRTTMPDLLKPETVTLFARGYPDSIRVLSPRSERLVALAKLPIAPSIPFHSIIGDKGSGRGEKSTDGVVPYSSAHLAGASSELIVPANHRTYDHPAAMAEVKRILKLHLSEARPSAKGGS
ncbi:MAG: alpha/beta fold hydrolase [Verrucomicrobiales bacterium]|nr:alpha/beta fold hydrolase [Verrucomicrobiales bacterium]